MSKKYEKAIQYFEEAIRDSDQIIKQSPLELQVELIWQKKHFETALAAMRGLNSAEKLLKESLTRLEIYCDCCENNLCYRCETEPLEKRIKEFLEQGKTSDSNTSECTT